MAEETIAAIATPLAPGGIGVLRISGSKAIETAEKIFAAKSGRLLCKMPGYTAAYGAAHSGDETLDECVALVFREPKSYTGEDVVELSCHGGVYLMRRLLRAALDAGARMAQPGEFTRRAYLNGKIDFTRAEAVMDLIGAQNELAVKAAEAQREGALFRNITALKAKLADTASEICAYLDFPDEDVPPPDAERVNRELAEAEKALEDAVSGYETGRMIREGAATVIVGRPNTGKSTLMNLLAGEDKSIVTAQPGTTRDVIEETVRLGDVLLRLADTAGLRNTEEEVEKIGVTRAKDRLAKADLILAVFDLSSPLGTEDRELLELCRGHRAAAVLNKCDLPQAVSEREIADEIATVIPQSVRMSAQNGEGIERLRAVVEKLLGTKNLDYSAGILANARQLTCAEAAREAVNRARMALDTGVTLDAVSVEIEAGVSALCELTGEKASDTIIDRVFENFCVGK